MISSNPRRVEHKHTDRGQVPVYTTNVVEQPWASYSRIDHEVWDTLFRRQCALLPGRVCDEFMDGVTRFGLDDGGIPRLADINRVLRVATGWELIAVEGLLPDDVFFGHLARRHFPVTWWIRKPVQLDYLSEPDLFHDLFGHLPLLLNPVFADYMQAYGLAGMKAFAIGSEALMNLARLYWYTVEFGLIHTTHGLRAYGAGMVSSSGESVYCLDSPVPNRLGFDLVRVMRTGYRIDTFQYTYFVIESFGQLFDSIQSDFTSLYIQLRAQPSFKAGDVLTSDKVFTRGTGRGCGHAHLEGRPDTLTQPQDQAGAGCSIIKP